MHVRAAGPAPALVRGQRSDEKRASFCTSIRRATEYAVVFDTRALAPLGLANADLSGSILYEPLRDHCSCDDGHASDEWKAGIDET